LLTNDSKTRCGHREGGITQRRPLKVGYYRRRHGKRNFLEKSFSKRTRDYSTTKSTNKKKVTGNKKRGFKNQRKPRKGEVHEKERKPVCSDNSPCLKKEVGGR